MFQDIFKCKSVSKTSLARIVFYQSASEYPPGYKKHTEWFPISRMSQENPPTGILLDLMDFQYYDDWWKRTQLITLKSRVSSASDVVVCYLLLGPGYTEVSCSS